ncbi:MAG: DNA alkylation repair protein [Ardenticatenaceae bacterium]|nr:DNA alkylation repair protein [Ardenticatenaceae bacterium]
MFGVQEQSVASLVEIVPTSNILPTLLRVAETTLERYPVADVFALAQGLVHSKVVQVRMLAITLLGLTADQIVDAKTMMRKMAANDDSELVHDALGVAFELYCSRVGYAYVQSEIAEWLTDRSPIVRRAVIEGLRVWTDRPYFDLWPEEAVAYLQWLVDDDDDHVAQSAHDALNEVYDSYPHLRLEV